jgi:hypothetical protein
MKFAIIMIDIAAIAEVMRIHNIPGIYFGINMNFVENGVVLIQRVKCVKVTEGH